MDNDNIFNDLLFFCLRDCFLLIFVFELLTINNFLLILYELIDSLMLSEKDCLSKPLSVRIDLKESDNEQHEILYALGLELMTPITILKSNIQLLKKYCIRTGDLFTDESFELCDCAVNDILCFIDYILFLCDPKQDSFKPKMSPFDLRSFVDCMLNDLEKWNFDTSRIHTQMNMDNPVICSDKFLLNRILSNILGNALKFSSSDIELNIFESDQNLNLQVCDHGIGIPVGEIMDIFKPFSRASNVKYITGSGLGLSLVSKSVQLLGGSVFVSSVSGKGTEFNVVVPFELAEKNKGRRRRVIHLKSKTCSSHPADNQMQLW